MHPSKLALFSLLCFYPCTVFSTITRKRKLKDTQNPTSLSKRPKESAKSLALPLLEASSVESAQLVSLLELLCQLPTVLNDIVTHYLDEKRFYSKPLLLTQFSSSDVCAFFQDRLLFAGILSTVSRKHDLLSYDLLSVESEIRPKMKRGQCMRGLGVYPDFGVQIFVDSKGISVNRTEDNETVLRVQKVFPDDQVEMAPSASKNGLAYMYDQQNIVLVNLKHAKSTTTSSLSPISSVCLNENGTFLAHATDDYIDIEWVQCDEDGGIELKEHSHIMVGKAKWIMFLKGNILAVMLNDKYNFYRIYEEGERAPECLPDRAFDCKNLFYFSYNLIEDIVIAFTKHHGSPTCENCALIRPFFGDTRILVFDPRGFMDNATALTRFAVSPDLTYMFATDLGGSCIYRLSKN